MPPSVDDYYSLLARAASVLENDTAEARQEVYDRARMALKAEFGKLDPPPSDEEALQERLKLDYAIHDFEWSMKEMGSFRPGETAYPAPSAGPEDRSAASAPARPGLRSPSQSEPWRGPGQRLTSLVSTSVR
jgi:hypothetical protein